MKIKITETIANYDGKPVKNGDSGTNMTWLDVASVALNTFIKDEVPTAEMKAKAFQVCTKIYVSKEPDLTVSEVAFIIERINKVFASPLICGKAEVFFNQKA